MFIPLGLGNWPCRFPFMIILLIGFNIIFSLSQFEVINQVTDKNFIENSYNLLNPTNHKIKFINKFCDDNLSYKGCEVRKYYTKESPLIINQDVSKFKKLESNYKNIKNISAMIMDHVKLRSSLSLDPESYPSEFKAHDSFEEFKNNIEIYQSEFNKYSEENNLLTNNNNDLVTILFATFSHASYTHLFGNLFMLFLFGIFIEPKIGSLFTLWIFLIGSGVGLFTKALFMPEYIFLIGSSAGVAAIMGAFLILYIKRKMRFLISYFFFVNQFIYFPVWFAIPFFYISLDLVGVGAEILNKTNVAHMAHLSGLLIGMLIAYIVKSKMKISADANFPIEDELYSKFKESNRHSEKLVILKKIYKINFQNLHPLSEFLLEKNRSNESVRLFDSNDEKKLVTNWLREYCLSSITFFNNRELIEFFKQVPLKYITHDVLKLISVTKRLKIADTAVKNGTYEMALHLYQNLYWGNYGQVDKVGIKQTIINIENYIGERNV